LSEAIVTSFGRVRRSRAEVLPLYFTCDAAIPIGRKVLPYGLGRSYGDACLNEGGVLLATRGLDRFVELDLEHELVSCESGVSLGEVLALAVPRGFFLPVVPGTKEVTVGGAIAHDVHGKNHHLCGTFGSQVESLLLMRSNGERLVCSRTENPQLFAATVGGLGLTGLILQATLRLRRITSAQIEVETLALPDLEAFFALSRDSDPHFEYTVAWIDSRARGPKLGRGLLYRGNHVEERGPLKAPPLRPSFTFPCELPFSLLNRASLPLMNALHYARSRLEVGKRRVDLGPFFFPLDGLGRWNLVYGRRGFFQFQTLVPPDRAPEAIRAILSTVAASGQGSFLTVLKNFGSRASPGLLSFPRPGTTLALDFANRGETTRRLFGDLHALVREAGGRIYPAKDALMPPEQFQAQHADVLADFRSCMDPAFSSSFWRRVTGD